MILQLILLAAVGPCGGVQLVSGQVRTGEVLRPDASEECLQEIGNRLSMLPRLRSVTVAARVTDEMRGKNVGLSSAKRAAQILLKSGIGKGIVSVVAPRTEAAEQPTLLIAYLEGPRGLPVARLRAASGRVTGGQPGTEPELLSPGADLYLLDQVATDEGVVADVALLDGSLIRLMPASRVRVISAETSGVARRKVQLELLDGEVVSDVVSVPDAPFEIRTQTAIAGVRGTRFRTAASGAGVRIETLEGAVNLGSGGKAVDVPAGKGSFAAQGQAPGRPVDLPVAPLAIRPLSGTARAPLILEWTTGVQLNDHRVELARDPDFVDDFRLIPVKGTSHQLTGLDGGLWFWRVTAISQQGFMGRPSKTYAFRIAPP